MRRMLLLVALASSSIGCSDSVSPSTRELQAAESRWRAQSLSHYTVETRVLCFCPAAMARWHEITVAGDSVIAARLVEPDASPTDEPAPTAWFRSVEAAFALARRWPDERRGNRVEAQFEAVSGLPTRLSFVTGPEIADGNATYEYRALKPGLTARQVR